MSPNWGITLINFTLFPNKYLSKNLFAFSCDVFRRFILVVVVGLTTVSWELFWLGIVDLRRFGFVVLVMVSGVDGCSTGVDLGCSGRVTVLFCVTLGSNLLGLCENRWTANVSLLFSFPLKIDFLHLVMNVLKVVCAGVSQLMLSWFMGHPLYHVLIIWNLPQICLSLLEGILSQ